MCWVPAGSERLWPDNGAIDARRTELKQKSDVRGFRTSLFLASSPPFRNRLGESGLSGLSLRFGLFAAAARIGLARRRSFIGAISVHRSGLETAFFQPALDLVFGEADVRFNPQMRYESAHNHQERHDLWILLCPADSS